jgi:hypothetical protein
MVTCLHAVVRHSGAQAWNAPAQLMFLWVDFADGHFILNLGYVNRFFNPL